MNKKPFHEVVAERLIQQLKQGTAPWQRPWEPGEPNGFIPRNPITGKRYKGVNAIALMAQDYRDPRWMTYRQAEAANAQVRKGEKGSAIQYWKFTEEQIKKDEQGKPGLFEYNKLLRSKHILNLINNMSLRKALRTARNRTESYHQLQGLIRKIYHGVFKGKKISDNRVSAHAARLVANCIIAYNSIILNTIYEKMLKDGVSQDIINEFARISPIAWAHIAFTGRYSFKKSNGEIDIAAMVLALEQHLKQHFWKIV